MADSSGYRAGYHDASHNNFDVLYPEGCFHKLSLNWPFDLCHLQHTELLVCLQHVLQKLLRMAVPCSRKSLHVVRTSGCASSIVDCASGVGYPKFGSKPYLSAGVRLILYAHFACSVMIFRAFHLIFHHGINVLPSLAFNQRACLQARMCFSIKSISQFHPSSHCVSLSFSLCLAVSPQLSFDLNLTLSR